MAHVPEGNTKFKNAELEAGLSFFQTIINSSHDWKFFQDQNGKILFSNTSIERITGFEKADFLTYKFSIFDILHPDDKECFQKKFQTSLQGQLVDSFEHRIINVEQNIVYCETSIIPVFSDEQKYMGICLSLKDISKRKQKEQGILNRLSTALLEQQATHQQLLTHEKILKRLGTNLQNGAIFQANTGPGGFFKFTYISEGAVSIYGYSSEELINDSTLYFKTINEQEYDNGKSIFNQFFTNGQINYYEKVKNAKTGEIKWTYIIADPSVLEDGLICWDGIILDHTELKNAEMVLKQSNLKINSLINAIPDLVFHMDKNGNYLDFYQERKTELFVSPKDFIGKNIKDIFEPDLSNLFLNSIQQALSHGFFESEYELLMQGLRSYRASYSKINEEEVLVLIRDITEHKKAEIQLKESEEKFSIAFRNSPYPIIISRISDGKILECNKAFLKTTGFTHNEAMLHTTLDLNLYVNKEDRAHIVKSLNNGKNIYNQECRFRKKSGEIIVGLISSEIINLRGEPCVLSIINDITQRIQDELKIIKLSTAVAQSPVAIVVTDLKGNIEYANPYFTLITGYSFEEVLGKNPKVLKSEYHGPEFYKELWETIYSGKIWKGTFLNRTKKGELFWEKATIAPIFNEKQEIINFLAVKEDITEIKKAEEALQESEEKLRAIFNSANVGIANINKTGDFVLFNQAILKILGYSAQEMTKLNYLDITFEEDIHASEHWRKISNKDVNFSRFERKFVRKDNSIIWGDVSISTILDGNNNILFYTFVITDITAQKQALDAKMLQTMIDAEEKERTRVAQELHDGVGPLISSAKMYAQLIVSPTSKMNKNEAALYVEDLLVEAQATVRQISYSLSPHILQNFGLIEALKSFSQKVSQASNLDISITGNNIVKSLNNSVETLLYRSLCECINNTIKHAGAKKIDIIFKFTETDVNIDYHDDGAGFDYDEMLQRKSGVGIFNMINRIKMVDGKIDIKSQPGTGVQINIKVKI